MSKHSNVNPDHYKVAGRERQGENVIHEVERREAKRIRQGATHQPQPTGISNRMSPDEEARDAAEHPPLDTTAHSQKVTGTVAREGDEKDRSF
jgi:hypothetical protein